MFSPVELGRRVIDESFLPGEPFVLSPDGTRDKRGGKNNPLEMGK
jgi:hypothetical protein